MFFPLMQLQTCNTPFSSSEYIFERKYDGIRLEYSNINEPLLYTRNQNMVNTQFPELLFHHIERVILDGEVICPHPNDDTDLEDFGELMRRFRMKKEKTILEHMKSNPVQYMVFDVLYYKDEDLRTKPLIERKRVLQNIAIENNFVEKISYIESQGIELFKTIMDKDYEGMIAKTKQSPYLAKRTPYWLKIINWIETEAVITGYRKEDKALLCCWEDGKPMGLVFHGINSNHSEAFFKITKTIINGEDREYVYIEPLLKCKLKGRGFTSKGILRSPFFLDFIY